MLKILVCNDDGIGSNWIFLLAKKLQKYGKVVICAPNQNRSCFSQALRYWEYDNNNVHKEENSEIETYSQIGTPADSINYYLKEFEKPDLLFSGVNKGLNSGLDICYSGTLGAAFEGIINGIPSVAISIHQNISDSNVNDLIDFILAQVFEKKLYSKSYVMSFNVPEIYNKPFELSLCKMNCLKTTVENTDDYYIEKGKISVSPLKVDRTDYEALSSLVTFFDNKDKKC